GPRPVAPATRARVLAAIDKLGYRPNSAARALITGQSRLLGLIVPDIGNPYFAGLAKAVEKEAASRELRLVLTQCVSEDLQDMVDSLAGHQVDGIITATLPPPNLFATALRVGIPMVKLSLAMPGDPFPALWPDFSGGSRSAVKHLVEVHGHTRVGLVTGGDQFDVRESAWRDALENYGLEPGPVGRVPWSPEGGWAAARELAEGSSVTAVFVASDQQAVGLLAGLHALGVRVPSDLAVASFDGSPSAEFTIPSLTTVGVPFAEMAADAIEEVLGAPATNRMFATTLVVRESCGCAPAERRPPEGAVP
ncbi:MAG: LacI family DNA-binding transcriptional regulator, partial [Propionicimonas sp.]